MSGIAGKRVLITGGSSGIGRAAAIAFAAQGAVVLVNHLADPGGAAETVRLAQRERSAANVQTADVDIALDEAQAVLIDACRRHFGGLDILVNNAAIKHVGDPIAYPAADYDRVMAVNLRAPFRLAQAAVTQFREQKTDGVILNLASVHDSKPLVSDIAYAMSKGGLAMMTKTLAAALGPEGIRVHGVSPGAIDTPMNAPWDEEARARYALTLPLQRVGNPDDVAGVILFLASAEASYMTGQTVYVDGGLLL